jgi:hypothetical protein
MRQDKQRIELTLRRSPVSSDAFGTLDGLLVVEALAEGKVKSSAFEVSARRAKGTSELLEAR